MKKQRILFLLFIFIAAGVVAQSSVNKRVELKWAQESTVVTSKNTSVNVPFIQGQGLDSNQLPLFFKSWDIQKGQGVKNYSISNIQYKIISSADFADLSINLIPKKISSSLRVSNARNESFLILEISPLVNENGVVRKVISFEISYSLKRKGSSAKNRSSKQISNSVLSTGSWYKFSVDTTGVYKLTRSFLKSLGMNTNGINPKNIKIYGNGGQMLPFKNSDFRYDGLQENAITVVGEGDGSFDSDDYILFYAVGPSAWKNEISNDVVSHQMNIFSDKSYYFITVDGSVGKRIVNETPITGTPILQLDNYNDYTFYEKDEINLFTIGQQWFGESFNFKTSHTFHIPFNDIDSNFPVTVKVRGVAESSRTSTMAVKVNGASAFNINYPAVGLGSITHAYAGEGVNALSISGNGVTVRVDYYNNGNPSAKAYLDYIEVIGTKRLIADGNQFGFRNFEAINTNNIVAYQIENSNNISKVWDVSDFLNPKRIENTSSGSSFDFNANGGELKKYQVLVDTDYYTPNVLNNSTLANQNLHSLNDIDYVIVTRDFLMNSAEKLADYHRQKGLTVEVVNLGKIYNEFSSGSPDLTAIRDFVKHLYDGASSDEKRIKYVCLFGDSSYDYKDRIQGNNNIVPVFEAYESFNLAKSYVTDDYYGMMDDDEGLLSSSDKQDVVTGRIIVDNAQQADAVVKKILNYYSTNSLGDWRNKITLVADDIDKAGEEALQESMELIDDGIKANQPVLNVKKIYADAYVQEISSGGERYPDVNEAIDNEVEQGSLLIDYFGHGGEDGWASERILEVPQIQRYNNIDNLPLFITITCEFTKFDNPNRLTAGEYVFWNSNGGAASLITTTREIYLNVGRAINDELIKYLLAYNGEYYSIAESLMRTKNMFSSNQRLFVYAIGDPAMKLAIPKPNIKLTHMNGVDMSQPLDTIKALSHIAFDGIVTDASGVLIPDFNGEVSAIVYDKEINKRTLVNDNIGTVMEFDALESKVFRGRATVKNGKFSFDFIAPKDLRIAYGFSKLSFYADDEITKKAGYNFDVVIGGINENAPGDTEGPQIQLYMNDENFVDGGNTNESPFLVAVLTDASGINTSITAVDHDIVAILDGDQANQYILNDFYQTELDDYTAGKVKFPFRDLEPGLHTLELCAWDTYNNSSCATLSFIVVNDSDLILDNVLNYPNPFVNYTEFWFNHNKPNEPLEVQIQIFTVSGKLVKTINQTVNSDGNLSRTINWNGLDDFGDKIGKGVYVYKLKVKSLLSNVTAEKYEKLVILQ